jgi:hypothetical protein
LLDNRYQVEKKKEKKRQEENRQKILSAAENVGDGPSFGELK